MKKYLVLIVVLLLMSCGEKSTINNCLESFLGGSIQFIRSDSTLTFDEVNRDSTEYSGFLNKKSSYYNYIKTNGLGGGQELTVNVSQHKVERLVFQFISVGDPQLSNGDVEKFLSANFCFEKPLIPDPENKLSKNSVIRNDVIIEATYYWERGVKGIIEIKYNLK